MATAFLKVTNNASSLLAADIAAGATSLSVSTGDGSAKFPAVPFEVSIDSEIFLVSVKNVDVFTVAGAQEGTSQAEHLAGAEVRLNITAKHISDINTAVNTLEALHPTALVAGRVVIAGAGGILTDDADFTFANETLTVTRIITGHLTASAADFNGPVVMTSSLAVAGEVALGAPVTMSSSLGVAGSASFGAPVSMYSSLGVAGLALFVSVNILGGDIAACDITVGSGKTLDVSAGTLTLADNQISGDKVEGGTIAAITIDVLTGGAIDIAPATAANYHLRISGTAKLNSGEQALYISFPSETVPTNAIWISLKSTATSGDLTGVRSRVYGNADSAGANVRGGYLEAKMAATSKYAAMLEGALAHADYSAGNATISGDVRGFTAHISQGAGLNAANLYGILVSIQTRGDESITDDDVGLMIRNEAVGGNGRTMDAAIKIADLYMGGGTKGFTYDIIFQNDATLVDDGTWLALAGSKLKVVAPDISGVMTAASLLTMPAFKLGDTVTLNGQAFDAGSGYLEIDTTGKTGLLMDGGIVNGGTGVLNYHQNQFGGDFVSGGAHTTATKIFVLGRLTGHAGDTTDLSAMKFNTSTTMTNNCGLVSTLHLIEPLITTGGHTVTIATTLYIHSTPTEGVTNAAIYVASGDQILASGVLKVGIVQVVGARVVDAKIDDAINAGAWDATTAGVLEACRDALVTHGLVAAS